MPALAEFGMVLLQRHLHVLAHRQRGKQRAVLEQHAGIALDAQAVGGIARTRIHAQHLDLPGIGRAQAEDGAHQHRFAGARAANHAEDFAAADVQIQAVVHGLAAKAIDQPAHADGQVAAAGGGVFGRVHRLTSPYA